MANSFRLQGHNNDFAPFKELTSILSVTHDGFSGVSNYVFVKLWATIKGIYCRQMGRKTGAKGLPWDCSLTRVGLCQGETREEPMGLNSSFTSHTTVAHFFPQSVAQIMPFIKLAIDVQILLFFFILAIN